MLVLLVIIQHLILLDKNVKIIEVDNLNNYYDIKLKKDRLKELKKKYKKILYF